MKGGHSGLSTDLPDVHVRLGELLDQRAVPELGGDVDRSEAQLGKV